MDRVDEIIAGVLAIEAGFVNHPADRGGATNWGVTLETLRADGAFFDHDYDNDGDVDVIDVQLLPRPDAAALLRRRYYERPGFAKLADPVLQELITDASVNHGPGAAIKLLQRALKVDDDGKLGPITITRANQAVSLNLRLFFVAERATLYGQIVTRDPVLLRAKEAGYRLQAENALGWMRRLADQIRLVN